jgi:hypothetical protein
MQLCRPSFYIGLRISALLFSFASRRRYAAQQRSKKCNELLAPCLPPSAGMQSGERSKAFLLRFYPCFFSFASLASHGVLRLFRLRLNMHLCLLCFTAMLLYRATPVACFACNSAFCYPRLAAHGGKTKQGLRSSVAKRRIACEASNGRSPI